MYAYQRQASSLSSHTFYLTQRIQTCHFILFVFDQLCSIVHTMSSSSSYQGLLGVKYIYTGYITFILDVHLMYVYERFSNPGQPNSVIDRDIQIHTRAQCWQPHQRRLNVALVFQNASPCSHRPSTSTGLAPFENTSHTSPSIPRMSIITSSENEIIPDL